MIEAYEYKQRNKRVIQLTIDSVPNYFIPSFDDVDSDLNKFQRIVHVLNKCKWDISLRAPKKIPHCLSKPKQRRSAYRRRTSNEFSCIKENPLKRKTQKNNQLLKN